MKLRVATTPDQTSVSTERALVPTKRPVTNSARTVHTRPESRDVHFTSNSILDSPSEEEGCTRTPPPPPPHVSRMLCRRREELGDQLRVVYRQFGSRAADVLELVHGDGIPSPPSRNHVVIKVEASTISLEDCIIRRGFDFDLLNPISLPRTPGMDVVGRIIKRPMGSDFSVGDCVAAFVRTGGNARYTCVHNDSLVRVPANIDPAEAVAMVSIYATAYQTLKRTKQEGSVFSMLGKKVLVIGGMDGVGQALIQMCCKARAIVYATGPTHRHTYIQNILGAQPLSDTDWMERPEVQGTMDYVFDGLCEDGLDTSHRALNETGEMVCFGHTAMLREKDMGFLGAPLSARVNKLWSQTFPRAKRIDLWESFCNDPETYKKNLRSLLHLLKWDKIKPNIAKRVGLEGVVAAQTKLESGELMGTVVCLPWKGKSAP